MSRRSVTWLAWTLCGIVMSLAVVLFGIRLRGSDGQDNVFRIVSDAVFSLAMPVVTVIVAALIVSRQPRNVVGWMLMVVVGSFLMGGPVDTYIEHLAPSLTAPTPLLLFAVWFSNWSWVLLIYPLLLIALLFPNGRPPTARWRWVGMAAIAWAVIFVALLTISQPLQSNTSPDLVLDNPVSLLSEGTAQLLLNAWVAGSAVLIALCVARLTALHARCHHSKRAAGEHRSSTGECGGGCPWGQALAGEQSGASRKV